MEGNVLSRVTSAGILLILCFVLAACGGGGDGTDTGSADATAAGSTEAGSGTEADTDGESGESEEEAAASAPAVSGPTLKKAVYLKQGDEVCEKIPQTFQQLLPKVNAELKEEEKKQKKKLSKKQGEEEVNLKAALPPIRTGVEEFAAIGSPEGDEEVAQEIVDTLQAAADGLEEDPSLPLVGKGSPFEDFVKVTKGYGFKTCPQL
jgi:hypothetical protein